MDWLQSDIMMWRRLSRAAGRRIVCMVLGVQAASTLRQYQCHPSCMRLRNPQVLLFFFQLHFLQPVVLQTLRQSWFVLKIGLHCKQKGNTKFDLAIMNTKVYNGSTCYWMFNLPANSWGSIGRSMTVWNEAIQPVWSSSVSHAKRNLLSGVCMVIPNCQWGLWMLGGRPGSTV